MFNSNSKFKQLNLAEKARSKFRTRPSGVRRGSVRDGPMHRPRNIFHSVLIKISRCALFLDSTGNECTPEIGLRILCLLSELAHNVKSTGPSRWTTCI